ncbi:MAG: tyrosine-protein phosphatase [Proteobacteria bacterium]|nr:tyrosine-protein phosphatase [Pseudomonadota bacterium]MBU1231381.1 tyrosine-protein phosphatase [Pseudomonadota bacterium]MBU1418604.1 tyrosine-protein phosphatase [Pseudomonadota bacterium]MBU1454186.1 tyrosine-protein phosphatase [Pseudomonadota bacterium]
MRNFLFCTTAVVFCLFFTPASAQQQILTPILASDANFRDLAGISASNGGTGFVNTTSNNGVMRTGIFYRSQALSTLTSADKESLSTLHIGLDIDLRTPREIIGTPSLLDPNAGIDWLPNGTDYLNVNIYGTVDPPSTGSVNSPETAVDYMKSTYQNFVTDPFQRAKFHEVLLALASEADAAVFHCSGGKDRTGWTAMLLQSIAGVSPSTIMDDYLASNSYMAAAINDILDKVPAEERATFAVMLGVQSEFLQAGLDQVTVSYGSLDAYLTQGLGLSQETIYLLRNKMVCYNSLVPALTLILL